MGPPVGGGCRYKSERLADNVMPRLDMGAVKKVSEGCLTFLSESHIEYGFGCRYLCSGRCTRIVIGKARQGSEP